MGACSSFFTETFVVGLSPGGSRSERSSNRDGGPRSGAIRIERDYILNFPPKQHRELWNWCFSLTRKNGTRVNML